MNINKWLCKLINEGKETNLHAVEFQIIYVATLPLKGPEHNSPHLSVTSSQGKGWKGRGGKGSEGT